MKNLHIYRSASTPPDTVTDVLAMAVDAANELTYFALRDRIIAVGTDMNVVNTFEWDFDGLGHLVMFDFLVDEMVLCAILSSGEILLVSTNDGTVNLETELRGVDIIGGAWSPDLGQLIVVTPDKLMALSREFVVDYDVDLYHAAPGKEQLQTIGWGARETQFQGLAGKQKRERIDPDTVPGGLNPNDDRRVLVSWRGDAQYFTVSTVEERPNPLKAEDPAAPAKVEARHLRVWSRDMELMSQCEPLNGMEPVLSMRPTGNLMAVPRVRDGKRDLWLYERNGQWRSHFTVGDADSEVVSVGWNIDSTVLLIHLRRNGVDLLQFWTISNYDWALKAETENQKLLTAKWDPESPRRLHFVTISGQYGFLEVEPGYNSRDCLIVSIAGGNVRVTDLTKAPMPPPMFHAVLSSGKTGVLLLTQSKYGLALLLSDMRLVTYRLENREYTPLSSVKLTNPLAQLPINLQWTNESAVSFICGRDVFAVDVLNGNEKLIITAPKQLVYHRRSPSNDAWFFLAVDGSWMSFADGNMSPSLLAVKFPVNSVDTHRCNIVDLGNRYILFGLNRNNQLLIDGHVVHQAVGHISYGSDAFLVTTLHHQLFAMSYDRLLELLAAPPKQTAKNSVFGWFAEGSGRAVERGSAVVAHESDGVRVFLQMPRGNLETVEPRFRLVPCLRQLIGAKRYRDAIVMMRRQRVDMNLLYDHDPDAFIANVVEFVEQVRNADLLNLFIFGLNEADTTRTSFAPFYPDRANTPAPPSGKVARTAEAVLKAVLDTKDIKKRQKIYTAALSCFLKREPRGIKEAFLDMREQVKAAGEVLQQTNEQYVNQTPSLFRRWTKHLRYFVKDGELFQAALQTYDLELAYEVADEINMDPREFLPLLESLKAKDNDAYRRYHIDLVVEDYEAALEHIADAEDKIDECIDHIKRHNLYSKALIVFNGKTNYNRIAQVCAENALSQRRHKEAGLLFEQAGDYLNALKAHELAMNVLDYVAAARRVPLDAPAIQRSLTVFALKFEQQGRYVQAAETYKMLDVEANLSKVVENFARAQNWSTALLEYNLHPFVESDARPKLIKEASSRYRTVLSELRSHLNEINTHAARLEILRAEKAKTVEEWVENEGDVDVAQSETMSEASSASGVSSISNISRLSRMSAAQAKRRKNVERKKKNVKQGSQYEDIGILTALTELFAKISTIQTELAELLPTLVALGLLSEARELQKEAERVVKAAADRRVEVWPRYLKPNNLPGPLHEIYRCEDGIIRMPGEGHMPTRIYLEDELFPPKFDTNLSWKLKALD
uniref:Elongator complex protein 1 n=1 Tax=Panagrellus redivivus TaxID=6233 RepID=A0A7E4VW73_PANRE